MRKAYQRVMQQVGTSNRTLPTLRHVFFCDTSADLERAIHRALKDQGKWAYCGAGTEWFNATVQDVVSAYEAAQTDAMEV